MKVSVDTGKCRGYASCILEAPKVFDIDEDENVVILLMTHPPRGLWDEVSTAARACPTNAIDLLEDD